MAPNWEVTLGRRGLLVPNTLFIGYSEAGGPLFMFGEQAPRRYRVVDPRTGEVLRRGVREGAAPIPDEGGGPRLYICWEGA
jgi:hypothetical protein